jgi:hypothetical protein
MEIKEWELDEERNGGQTIVIKTGDMIYTSKLPADSAGMLYGHLISVSENVD